MTAAGLLLATDWVELYPPAAGADAHGWEQPGAEPYWAGTGNLQEQPGFSDPRMNGGGGQGPYAPHQAQTSRLYLPPGAAPVEGSAALLRGRWWVLSQVRLVPDPTAPTTGGISCWTATATSTGQWTEA
jgi:hypothetical protein